MSEQTPQPSPSPEATPRPATPPLADKVEAPITKEGFYALHQVYRVRWRALEEAGREGQRAVQEAVQFFERATATKHSALYSVAGGKGDLMVVHFRPTFDTVNAVELAQARLAIQDFCELSYCYISVTEASGYDSARKRQEAMFRQQGVAPDSETWVEAMKVMDIQEQAFLKARLEPTIPETRYACFYPMNKRRGEIKNWYKLTNRERGELMRGHAEVGRRWTDRVTQLITGSIGFDDFEWGVTLFADDPVLFKRLVYEMRFDPVSSDYAEFGPFMTGVLLKPKDLVAFFNGHLPGVTIPEAAPPTADDKHKDDKAEKETKEAKERRKAEEKAREREEKEKHKKKEKPEKDEEKDENGEKDEKSADDKKADDKKADDKKNEDNKESKPA